eukprot:scaffold185653_cov21-Prasinocladus_malaysianus.AAC.1
MSSIVDYQSYRASHVVIVVLAGSADECDGGFGGFVTAIPGPPAPSSIGRSAATGTAVSHSVPPPTAASARAGPLSLDLFGDTDHDLENAPISLDKPAELINLGKETKAMPFPGPSAVLTPPAAPSSLDDHDGVGGVDDDDDWGNFEESAMPTPVILTTAGAPANPDGTGDPSAGNDWGGDWGASEDAPTGVSSVSSPAVVSSANAVVVGAGGHNDAYESNKTSAGVLAIDDASVRDGLPSTRALAQSDDEFASSAAEESLPTSAVGQVDEESHVEPQVLLALSTAINRGVRFMSTPAACETTGQLDSFP